MDYSNYIHLVPSNSSAGALKFILPKGSGIVSMQLNAIENAKIDCCTQLFNEMSTKNVRYHKVTCYQDLIDAMTAAK